MSKVRRIGDAMQEEALASESKKEKHMSLTRDFSYDKLRWREIIRDFVK